MIIFRATGAKRVNDAASTRRAWQFQIFRWRIIINFGRLLIRNRWLATTKCAWIRGISIPSQRCKSFCKWRIASPRWRYSAQWPGSHGSPGANSAGAASAGKDFVGMACACSFASHSWRRNHLVQQGRGYVRPGHVVVGAVLLVTGALLTIISFEVLIAVRVPLPALPDSTPVTGCFQQASGVGRQIMVTHVESHRRTHRPAAASVEKTRFAVFADLIKARLTFLVLLTTLGGFYIGFQGLLDLVLLFHTMLGTALVASGASALNQYLERAHDARMERTEDRPLPSGRMQPGTVLIFGGACSGLGLIYLAMAVNPLTSLLGAITLRKLCVHLHTTQTGDDLEHHGRRGAGRAAAVDLLGWTAARR